MISIPVGYSWEEQKIRLLSRIETLLNKKYADVIKACSCMTEEELFAEWEIRFTSGDYGALLWSVR